MWLRLLAFCLSFAVGYEVFHVYSDCPSQPHNISTPISQQIKPHAPQAATSACRPFTKGRWSGTFQAMFKSRVLPEYPKAARKAGVSGDVVIEVEIGEDGKPQSVKCLKGPVELQKAACTAAQKSKFLPRCESGAHVCDHRILTYRFTL
ncbi:MAG: energy transducer TonB [Blastocatellia bacterium]|nr:energy transducer TonB [Blastocatellia bacterium]